MVDHAVDELLAPLAQLLKTQAHPRRPSGTLVLGARPHHLAAPADQLEAVTEPELELQHGARRLRRAGANEHAARRNVGGKVAEEAAEAVELELHARLQGDAA